MINGAASHDLEILRVLDLLGSGIIERAGEADAIEGILRDAVDQVRRSKIQDVVEGRDHVVHMQELRTRCRIGRDLCRPADGQRIAGTAEVRGEQLGAFVGRAARPGPASVVLIVGLGRTEHVEATQGLQRGDVLFGRGGNAILRQQFTAGAMLAFGGGAVVAPDIQDKRVIAVAEPIHCIHQPPNLIIDVFGIAGQYLHQAALEGPLVLGNAVPRG